MPSESQRPSRKAERDVTVQIGSEGLHHSPTSTSILLALGLLGLYALEAHKGHTPRPTLPSIPIGRTG